MFEILPPEIAQSPSDFVGRQKLQPTTSVVLQVFWRRINCIDYVSHTVAALHSGPPLFRFIPSDLRESSSSCHHADPLLCCGNGAKYSAARFLRNKAMSLVQSGPTRPANYLDSHNLDFPMEFRSIFRMQSRLLR